MSLVSLLLALQLMAGRKDAVTTTSTSSSTTTVTTTSTSSSTAGGGTTSTSSTSSSTVTTTSSTTTTTVIDGEAIYHANNNTTGGTTFYAGAYQGSATQTSAAAWWTTHRAYSSVSGTGSVLQAPGAGKSWDLSLIYSTTALGAGESCGDHVGSTTSTSLCSISGTNKSCTFSASSLSLHADSCFQVVFTATGSPGNEADTDVAVAAKESTTDGITAYSNASATAGNASPTWFDIDGTTVTTVENRSHLVFPKAVNSCSGMLALGTAPGVGNSWDYDVEVSTAGMTTSQYCGDLTYTSVTGCTVSGTNKNCSFGLNTSMVVPAGGCLRVKKVKTGTPGTTTQNWAVECTADTAEPATTGGSMFAGATSLSLGTTTFCMGQVGRFNGCANELQYWRTGSTTYSKCSGVFSSSGTGAGSSTPHYDIKLSYSTGSLAGTNACSGATYTTTSALCTFNVGTDKSCSFTNAAVSIPANACVTLKAELGGTISTQLPTGNWSIVCEP